MSFLKNSKILFFEFQSQKRFTYVRKDHLCSVIIIFSMIKFFLQSAVDL